MINHTFTTQRSLSEAASRREAARHYISASDTDIDQMLAAVGKTRLEDLFDHIPAEARFAGAPPLPEELEYRELQARLQEISERNRILPGFLGDGLPDFETSPVTGPLCELRKLTTAYTPYQPELSQGTLIAHWIYQCTMSALTGFEAINASLYERSTAMFEGICAAVRMTRGGSRRALMVGAFYPGDIEVLQTLAEGTSIELSFIAVDASTGVVDPKTVRAAIEDAEVKPDALVFPQVNNFGNLEPVDALTDLAAALDIKSIAVIDPILLGKGGLKAPVHFGTQGVGVDIIVGEAQHLALGPNFGGPGLGLFGIRFDAKNRNNVRSAPGRFIGKGRDVMGRDCRVSVLSTREQHIRKDKATSNICSNQAFVATLVGAALLERGDEGLAKIAANLKARAEAAAACLCAFPGVDLAFPETPAFGELTLALPGAAVTLIEAAEAAGVLAGVDVSARIGGGRHLLKLSFSDKAQPLDALASVFEKCYGAPKQFGQTPKAAAAENLRADDPGITRYGKDALVAYYTKLGELNVSPDEGCYPLGSCTMKYNPAVNDWAAGLPGFANLHPQAPASCAQGALFVLHEIQNWFKAITGLAAVTTQPVAGAQGELVGLKLFQAYHRDRGERRDIILIPQSSHGTNFATATMAGFTGKEGKIVYLGADTEGRVQLEEIEAHIETYGERIAGVMITNPNTTGIFETHFAEIAKRIHAIGGLVYMDGANMNAIAGQIDLGALGVDAVHNNLHKTWTIPHGGGGPGDAIVAVSARLAPYLPGYQIKREGGRYVAVKPERSIGSFHRHWGNFAHKVRCYTYLLRLGAEGVSRMSAVAVLSARYLHQRLGKVYATLPEGSAGEPRMHEFIITLKPEVFAALEAAGVRKVDVAPRLGKLFLDFGFHAPTVSWPETLGLMIEPTESYTKAELDRFADAVEAILRLAQEHPEVLASAPHFTPIDRVNEVEANREVCLSESLTELPVLNEPRLANAVLTRMPVSEIYERIVAASQADAPVTV